MWWNVQQPLVFLCLNNTILTESRRKDPGWEITSLFDHHSRPQRTDLVVVLPQSLFLHTYSISFSHLILPSADTVMYWHCRANHLTSPQINTSLSVCFFKNSNNKNLSIDFHFLVRVIDWMSIFIFSTVTRGVAGDARDCVVNVSAIRNAKQQ